MIPHGASTARRFPGHSIPANVTVHRLGQLSPDGSQYWDSQRWVPATSRDRKWRWNGKSWVPIGNAGQTKAPRSVLAAAASRRGSFLLRGLKIDTRSMVVVAVPVLLLILTSFGAFELGVLNTWQQQIARLTEPPSPWFVQPSPQAANPTPSPADVAARTAAAKLQALSPHPSPTPPHVPAPPTCGAPPNPFGYDFCPPASLIYKPDPNFCVYFNCVQTFWVNANGYVEECADNTYSHRGGHSDVCLHHGGVRRALYS
jgi:hypothetical protein